MASTTTNMGLREWNDHDDLFAYTELANNFVLLDAHDHSAGKGVQIPTAGLANAAVTGTKIAAQSVDATKLAGGGGTGDIFVDPLLSQLGVNTGTIVKRGKAINLGVDTRSSTTYGTMPTPDAVNNIIVPSEGWVIISYHALWKTNNLAGTVTSTGVGEPHAALFIDGNQLRQGWDSTSGQTLPQETIMTAGGGTQGSNTWTAKWTPFTSLAGGQVEMTTQDAQAILTTTGIAISVNARVVIAGLAAGSHNFSIQFKDTGAGISVKDRRLHVVALGF